MENRNYISNAMPNVFKSNGKLTETEAEIKNEVKLFYEDLYIKIFLFIFFIFF